jgi:hypothetical protein
MADALAIIAVVGGYLLFLMLLMGLWEDRSHEPCFHPEEFIVRGKNGKLFCCRCESDMR